MAIQLTAGEPLRAWITQQQAREAAMQKAREDIQITVSR